MTRRCAGALILVDTPLFTVPDSAHTEDPATLDAELARRVAALEPAARDYFYSLADCKVVLQKVPSEWHPKVRNHGEGPY